jgi:hypothetical protein
LECASSTIDLVSEDDISENEKKGKRHNKPEVVGQEYKTTVTVGFEKQQEMETDLLKGIFAVIQWISGYFIMINFCHYITPITSPVP